jgi:hypothetical protein
LNLPNGAARKSGCWLFCSCSLPSVTRLAYRNHRSRSDCLVFKSRWHGPMLRLAREFILFPSKPINPFPEVGDEAHSVKIGDFISGQHFGNFVPKPLGNLVHSFFRASRLHRRKIEHDVHINGLVFPRVAHPPPQVQFRPLAHEDDTNTIQTGTVVDFLEMRSSWTGCDINQFADSGSVISITSDRKFFHRMILFPGGRLPACCRYPSILFLSEESVCPTFPTVSVVYLRLYRFRKDCEYLVRGFTVVPYFQTSPA